MRTIHLATADPTDKEGIYALLMQAVGEEVLVTQRYSWQTPLHSLRAHWENHTRKYMRSATLRAEPLLDNGALILPADSYMWRITYPDFAPYDSPDWRTAAGPLILTAEELAGKAIEVPELINPTLLQENDYRFQLGGTTPKHGTLDVITGSAAHARSTARMLYDEARSLS